LDLVGPGQESVWAYPRVVSRFGLEFA
jgi:hypothetical protein